MYMHISPFLKINGIYNICNQDCKFAILHISYASSVYLVLFSLLIRLLFDSPSIGKDDKGI